MELQLLKLDESYRITRREQSSSITEFENNLENEKLMRPQ